MHRGSGNSPESSSRVYNVAMQKRLKQVLQTTLQGLGVVLELASIPLEHPSDLQNGDYATGVALQVAKQAGMKPKELAEKIVSILGEVVGVAKIEIAGPGFINFYLSSEAIGATLEDARTSAKWGANENEKEKKIMVEYTDPNPFKEFHIGHLMSNAIGEAFTRLLDFSGATVVRANWQGDVGPHVAKTIWGKMQKPELGWGEAYAYGSEHYEENKEVVDEINKKVYEKNNEEINTLYAEGRKVSLERFEEIYRVLGTKFDYYFFEGIEGLEGVEIVKTHLRDGVFEESQGAVVFPGEKYGLHTRVFLTSKGLPTYEAKELGLNKAKFEKEPDLDESIIVTAQEQEDYFKVILKAIEIIFPDIGRKTKHIPHGMMRFAEGKMSSRKGNVITGESLLADLTDAARERAKESRAEDPEKLAEQVAVAAVKYQILRQATGKDIVFNREQALSLEGDSGPYIQYAHARACAIMEKADEQGVNAKVDVRADPTALSRLAARFPDIVERAAQNLEPQLVANYLVGFAGAFNSWYAQEQILDGTEKAAHKVALADAARQTLKNGLWLLGIPAPERM